VSEASGSTCPRCGGTFHCGVKDEVPCWCTQVRLSPQTLAELEKQYTTCLCTACLAALSMPSPSSTEARHPDTR
jgi:hypothetical protein